MACEYEVTPDELGLQLWCLNHGRILWFGYAVTLETLNVEAVRHEDEESK